jgi:hypothetical protein
LKAVGRVRELGTAGAHGFLQGLQAKWPKGGSPHVLQAIDEAVRATSASPGRVPRGRVQ